MMTTPSLCEFFFYKKNIQSSKICGSQRVDLSFRLFASLPAQNWLVSDQIKPSQAQPRQLAVPAIFGH